MSKASSFHRAGYGGPDSDGRRGGNRLKMFFDTGAKISYVDQETANAYPRVGTAEDYYMTVGPFQTAVHRIPMIAGQPDHRPGMRHTAPVSSAVTGGGRRSRDHRECNIG